MRKARGTSGAAGPGPGAPPKASVLVLAGRRAGVDSLSETTRVSHKCLLELAGEPMILRVIRAVRADPVNRGRATRPSYITSLMILPNPVTSPPGTLTSSRACGT